MTTLKPMPRELLECNGCLVRSTGAPIRPTWKEGEVCFIAPGAEDFVRETIIDWVVTMGGGSASFDGDVLISVPEGVTVPDWVRLHVVSRH